MKYTVGPYGKFFYFDNCAIGRTIAEGFFWENFYKQWFDALHPLDVVVDVGANIGFFSIYAASKGASVWAFEVSPQVFEVLVRNVDENRALEVRCENRALFDRECELVMNPEWVDVCKGQVTDYEKMENSGGMSLVAGSGEDVYHSRTLDSYELSQCDLIKVDTQGADLRVLVGARETIKKHRPTILVELEPVPARLHGDSEAGMQGFFREMDYDLHCVRYGEYGVQDFVAVPRG